MNRLVKKISNDLETFQESYIYDSELARLWPTSMSPKEGQQHIQKFAKENGFDVNVYEIGMCAIFKKPPRKAPKGRPV